MQGREKIAPEGAIQQKAAKSPVPPVQTGKDVLRAHQLQPLFPAGKQNFPVFRRRFEKSSLFCASTPCSSPPDRRRRVNQAAPAPPRNAPEIPCPSNPCGNPPGGDPARRRRNRGVPSGNGTNGREGSGAAEQQSTASNRNTNPPPGAIRERNAHRFLPAASCGSAYSTPFPRTGSRASPAGTAPLFLPGKTRLTATSRFQAYPCLRSRRTHGIRTPLRPHLFPRPHQTGAGTYSAPPRRPGPQNRYTFPQPLPCRCSSPRKHRCFSGQSPGRGRPCPAIRAISPPYGRKNRH